MHLLAHTHTRTHSPTLSLSYSREHLQWPFVRTRWYSRHSAIDSRGCTRIPIYRSCSYKLLLLETRRWSHDTLGLVVTYLFYIVYSSDWQSRSRLSGCSSLVGVAYAHRTERALRASNTSEKQTADFDLCMHQMSTIDTNAMLC